MAAKTRTAALVAVVSALIIVTYVAGRADAAPSDAVVKLNQTHDFLTKARALLDATPTNRLGYGDVEKAKANVNAAMAEVEKAVVANGG